MADIHNYKRKLERCVIQIKESTILNANKEHILNFYSFCIADGLSPGKLLRHIDDLKLLDKWTQKDFANCKKSDIQQAIVSLENTKYSEWTKFSFKATIKKFYKWLRNTEEMPEEVKWIKMRMKQNNKKLPEELLTEDEIKKMIMHAKSPRDKALIASLYESGARISELASIQLKHLTFDEYGLVITISGKKGSRRNRLVFSAPYIQGWLNSHPDTDNSQNYLFIGSDLKILCYNRIKTIIKSAADKAHIKKKVNPHNFRHSRATHLAGVLSESQLKVLLGWTQASKMASVYVHLSGRDVDKAVLKLHGITVEEDKKQNVLAIQLCSRCNTKNQATNKYCNMCGMVLDQKECDKVVQNDFERNDVNELMSRLLKDPEVQQFLTKKMKECV